jgi:nucleolar protein 58
MGITCKTSESFREIFRGIRCQLSELIEGFNDGEFRNMTLGLAHGLSRYKLKFSSEKVDIMIIQAISMLDDLDKELNNYMMRLREWYGWHFPEMSKIITDNLLYAKTVRKIGMRTNTHKTDLSEILPEEIE